MAAPMMESSMDEWLALTEKLSPFENFALVGLLSLRPGLQVSIIQTGSLKNEENIAAAEKWFANNFRTLFSFYCKNYKKVAGEITVEWSLKKGEIIKALAPNIVTFYSLPLGIAVAFLAWALAFMLDKWCQKYAQIQFNGKGKYQAITVSREFDEIFFDVTYTPAIEELVDDPEAFPLLVKKPIIRAKAALEGLIKVANDNELAIIRDSFRGSGTHSFSFTDTGSRKQIKGTVENVYPNSEQGPRVLTLIAADVEV